MNSQDVNDMKSNVRQVGVWQFIEGTWFQVFPSFTENHEQFSETEAGDVYVIAFLEREVRKSCQALMLGMRYW